MAQIAGMVRIPEAPSGAYEVQRKEKSRSDDGLPVRGPNVVIERWLQVFLRQLYQETCNEPLPSELNEMIDRFRKGLQDHEDDRDAVVSLVPSVRQRS